MAQRIARAGPSKMARKPSPIVFTSRPRWRASSRRTVASWRSSSVSPAPVAEPAAMSVEPTMSVKRTVASALSGFAAAAAADQELLDLVEEGVLVAGECEVVLPSSST